jgi:predicted enzyme related to lactoylglutathione lyase
VSHEHVVHALSGARITHLFLMVYDLDVMLQFYRDLLGMQVTHSVDNECAFLEFTDGVGPQLAIYRGRRNRPEGDPHWFVVVDVADIELVARTLAQRGIEVGAIQDVPYGRALKLRDPEGNTLEIHQGRE